MHENVFWKHYIRNVKSVGINICDLLFFEIDEFLRLLASFFNRIHKSILTNYQALVGLQNLIFKYTTIFSVL